MSASFADESHEQLWKYGALQISAEHEERIRETLSILPESCTSVLDVGCGDGRITNRLLERYKRVVGLDSSSEALRHVQAKKVLSSIDSLPFPDRDFDAIISSEVLEHLPVTIYDESLKEMERVAANYLLITVPNNENLKLEFVTCPQCGCVFNVSRHVRSFQREDMLYLFRAFDLISLKLCQPMVKEYPIFVTRVARFLKVAPNIGFPVYALCPQCGYSSNHGRATDKIENRAGIRSRFVSLAKRTAPVIKQKGWFIALYQRK